MNLAREGGRPLVTGHRGAAAEAPENTLASLEAAVAAGVDLVEFDVGSAFVLAHSADEVPDEPISLDDALAFLGAAGVGIHLDVKAGGIEEQLAAAVRRHGLAERTVVSAVWGDVLRRFAAVAPELARAITYPHDRHNVSSLRWPGTLTKAGAAALRSAMPLRIPLLLGRAQANALSLHHGLVSEAAVKAAHARGAPVIAWTANEPAVVERVVAAGVDAVVSDDPRMVFRTLDTLNIL